MLLHRHRLLKFPDGGHDVLLRRLPDDKPDAGDHGGFKTRLGGIDFVSADGQGGRTETAGVVARQVARRSGVHVLDDDVCSSNSSPGQIRDLAGYSRVPFSSGERRKQSTYSRE